MQFDAVISVISRLMSDIQNGHPAASGDSFIHSFTGAAAGSMLQKAAAVNSYVILACFLARQTLSEFVVILAFVAVHLVLVPASQVYSCFLHVVRI